MKTYNEILTEAIKDVTIEGIVPGFIQNAGSAVMGGVKKVGSTIAANPLKTAAVAGVGAFALMRMKKNKCRQKCTAIQDLAQRQSCISQC